MKLVAVPKPLLHGYRPVSLVPLSSVKKHWDIVSEDPVVPVGPVASRFVIVGLSNSAACVFKYRGLVGLVYVNCLIQSVNLPRLV